MKSSKEFLDLLRRIGIGAIGGAAFAGVHFWIAPFNLTAFLGAVCAGACFAILVGTIASFLHNRTIQLLASILAGFIAGSIWSFIVRPAVNTLSTAIIGAVFATIIVIADRSFKEKVSPSDRLKSFASDNAFGSAQSLPPPTICSYTGGRIRLINITEFFSNVSLDEIKNRMEKQTSWRLEYYEAEHAGKVGVYVDGKIQDGERKHGYLHGVLWECLLQFTIEIGGQPPSSYFYRATMQYPEEIQNMFQAKDIRWKELTKPYDDKLRNLIVTLDGVVADID